MSVARELAQFPVFRELDPGQVAIVATEVSRLTVEPGEVVFRAGEYGDAMGLLASGKLNVHIDRDGEDVHVGSVYPYEIFGEMACVEPAPRGATVLAETRSDVFFLSRDAMERITRGAPDAGVALRSEILRLLTARLKEVDARIEATFAAGRGGPESDDSEVTVETLRGVTLLEDFSEAELRALITVAPPRFYPPGHVLCRQGEQGDSAFIITRGSVDVVIAAGAEERTVTTLGAGSIAGQIALVTGEPRTATLVVTQRSLVLTLAAENFERLLAAHSPFAVRFQTAVIRAAIDQLSAANKHLARRPG